MAAPRYPFNEYNHGSKFKSPVGQFYTRQLFYETTLADKANVLYTLKDYEHKGFPSLYKFYMDTNDPTEWVFATTYLDNWTHWETLCACDWFKPYVNRWRRELELRLRSEHLARIIKAASSSENRDATAASKYIVERGWDPHHTKGRPTKAQIRENAHEILSNQNQLNADFKRINLSS